MQLVRQTQAFGLELQSNFQACSQLCPLFIHLMIGAKLYRLPGEVANTEQNNFLPAN